MWKWKRCFEFEKFKDEIFSKISLWNKKTSSYFLRNANYNLNPKNQIFILVKQNK